MSRPCSQCDRPLGDDLALRCANPRCSSVAHSACVGSVIDDGGRVPRWRCDDCRPSSASYQPVFGRPQGGALRPKDAEIINRPIDAKARLAFRDKFGPVRGSTGTLADDGPVRRPEPTRPRSAILTPTDEIPEILSELGISRPSNSATQVQLPSAPSNLSDSTYHKKFSYPLQQIPPNSSPQKPSNLPLQTPSNSSPQKPSSDVPVRIVTPDEKYEESVKSFYKWLQDHECSSKDKPKPSGLVRDKIALFGAKLENHLAARHDKPTPSAPKSGAGKLTHPNDSTAAQVGTKKPSRTDEIHDEILVVRDQMAVQNPPANIKQPKPQILGVKNYQPRLVSVLKTSPPVDAELSSEPSEEQPKKVKFVDTPKFSKGNQNLAEMNASGQSDDDDDFPPPPPPLETNLDEISEPIPEYSADEPIVVGSRVTASNKNFNDPVLSGGRNLSETASVFDPAGAKVGVADGNASSSVGHVVHQDARIVHHPTLPSRGEFTVTVKPADPVQGVLVQEVDEGQPCLACEKCQGFELHHWRKTCNSCKCPRESHDVYHEEWVNVRERLGIGGDPDKWGSRDKILSQGLAWAPPGLPPYKLEQYFKCLPSDKVPKLGTPGEKYRERQLMLQLPKQDLALAYTRHVDSAHQTSYEDFIAARNDIACDIGYATVAEGCRTCKECGGSLSAGDVGVLASKFGADTLWHPNCFICSVCKELLVDLTYCVHEGQLYCERHYAEQLKPRCSACDELIFSGEYTRAMNKDWHTGHFSCWQCDESLTGQRYVLREDHPYCIKCYESVFANTCDECNKIIGIDSKDLSYKDKHWHEACFACSKCHVSLVDRQFGSKADKIYCGNCFDAQFAARCDGCTQIFRAGTKKMEYKSRQWHEQCFVCVVCKTPIGTKSFIPREQEIYCAPCYEEKFATRCVKCNKIITSGGVTYRNEPWHRECFTCTNCNTPLAGQRFTSRDEKPYCADCFGELFAKRCTACTKPITGIGGTRFISFEDRHWHNDCFICSTCKTSLVGRGFITDGEDILCTECAKQKLM